jgi:hypothetical protein
LLPCHPISASEARHAPVRIQDVGDGLFILGPDSIGCPPARSMSPRMQVASSGPAEQERIAVQKSLAPAGRDVSSMNFRICCAIRMLCASESILGTHLQVSGHISGRHEFGGVTGALVALRETAGKRVGRQKCRRTSCHLESRRPPAFELLQMGTYEAGIKYPLARNTRGRRSFLTYSAPRRKKLLPLCVRCGCLRGGRMECFWSKNSICDWQAGARRLDSATTQKRISRFDRICHCPSMGS